MNGCFNGCWHDHCTASGILGKDKLHPDTHTYIHKLPVPVGNYTLSFHIRKALRSNHTFGNQVLELFSRASVRIYLRFACIHAQDCLSSCFQFTTVIVNQPHRLIVFWDTLSSKWNSAPYRTLTELHAGFHPSVQSSLSPLWLCGPAGIIDHPSAHYHTKWRSHPSYETQDDPEHWISVLGLISCPNWPIVHQRGFCTFHCLLSTDEDAQPVKKKNGCSMMHSQWPDPFPFFTHMEFYRARKRKDSRTQGSPCKYCHRDLESVTVLLQCW